jgi:hypothetical protein
MASWKRMRDVMNMWKISGHIVAPPVHSTRTMTIAEQRGIKQ